ncbi:MAG: hypothetical protein RLZZ116_923 [Planctomycetota bacterium]|jgi:hypothetical protein
MDQRQTVLQKPVLAIEVGHGIVFGACALACVASAAQGGSDDELLREQIRLLREQNEKIATANAALADKVSQLEQRVDADDDWLTEARVEEIRAVVSDVLADSMLRESLAADPATAGWDSTRGFFLASADNNFTLRFRGRIQTRWAMDQRDIGGATAATGSPANTSPDNTHGFEMRRVQFMFGGNFVDPSWTYFMQYATTRNAVSGLNNFLEDAWVEKALGDGYFVRTGQFRPGFIREDLVSSGAQMSVERSNTNELFTAARSQGVMLGWIGEHFKFDFTFSDELRAIAAAPTTGAGAAGGVAAGINTGFNFDTVDYAFCSRLEFMPYGEWRQFRDLQGYRGEAPGALFGVAAYIQQLTDVPTPTVSPDIVWSVTADASLEYSGFAIFGYGVYRGVTLQQEQAVRGGGTDDSLSQWGALIQAGVFVTDSVEWFTRYEIGNTDTDKYRTSPTALEASAEANNVLTTGFTWWPASVKNRGVKFVTDIGYAFCPVVDFASNGADWLPDYTAQNGATNDGQWVVRSQLQLQF